MAAEIIMPKLGMSMVEGTVIAWKKKIGERVNKGDGIVDISSEKIEMEVESPADGILLKIAVAEGGVVPYGTVLGFVGEEGELAQVNTDTHPAQAAANEAAAMLQQEVAATITVEPDTTTVKASPTGSAQATMSVHGTSERSSVKISPVAKKIAEEADLPIESIKGTGPQGRITKEDVEQAIAERNRLSAVSQIMPPPVQPDETRSAGAAIVERTPVAGMRKVIATRMQESLQQSAQLTLTLKADVTDLLLLQKQLADEVQKRTDGKLTVTDFITRAAVLALLQHKKMNSAYIEDRIETYGHVHMGIAVAVENGLVVPVIHHAERLTLLELSQSIRSLSQRARNHQLGSDEMKGSTFTITNLGAYGIETFTPVLNPPEAGILGVGAIAHMPVYHGEQLQRRSLLPLSLTFDHRVLDGAPAAQFLQTIKGYLEAPYSLLL